MMIPKQVGETDGNPVIMDSYFGNEIGFTSDIFMSSSYIWRNLNVITLSVIAVRDGLRYKGYFQKFLRELVNRGYIIRAVNPISDVMVHILEKFGFRKTDYLDTIYKEWLEVWVKC